QQVANIIETINEDDFIELIAAVEDFVQQVDFRLGIQDDVCEHVHLPILVQRAQPIGKSIFDSLDAVSGREGIAHKGEPPASGLYGGGIFDVVATTRRI